LTPVIALTDPATVGSRTPLASVINLASLSLLVWGITTQAHLGLGGRHLVALIALVLAGASWIGWIAGRHLDLPQLALFSAALCGLAGGALTPFAPLALVFVGVAALWATMAWDFSTAVWIALSGPAAMAVALPLAGHDPAPLGGAAAVIVAGAAMGISRRQSLQATTRAAEIKVTEARAEAERARAELLAGRNHMARELHDVLAHTLSALSLQLEALDAVISAEPEPSAEVREQLEVTKRLVRTGLDEARGAVRALREDAPPLVEQLAGLAGDRHAALDITGSPRRLGPDVSLALYRVAQEALTNVVKHAPGATAEVKVAFEDDVVSISVTNGRSHANGSPPSNAGGGYGIQGIKERVLLLGGRVEAGPTEEGWRVLAEVPA
jgi:signal transduction histidine kinase